MFPYLIFWLIPNHTPLNPTPHTQYLSSQLSYTIQYLEKYLNYYNFPFAWTKRGLTPSLFYLVKFSLSASYFNLSNQEGERERVGRWMERAGSHLQLCSLLKPTSSNSALCTTLTMGHQREWVRGILFNKTPAPCTSNSGKLFVFSLFNCYDALILFTVVVFAIFSSGCNQHVEDTVSHFIILRLPQQIGSTVKK